MWHDAVRLIADGGDNPSSAIPTSIIGLIIITIPATITAVGLLVSRLPRRGNRPQDQPPEPLPLPVNPLNSDEVDGAGGSVDRKRVRVLELWMMRNRLDPTKVKRGNEAIDRVRMDPQ